MASTLQLRGGSTATVNAITAASREVLVDTTTNRLRVGDGSTAGGHVVALLADVSAHPGITNLSGSGTASVYTIASDTGTNATIPAATNAAAGVATAAQITELEALRTNVGNSATSTNLGTFTGVTIQDNRTVKQALQDLETEVEDRLPDFVQWRAGTGPGYYVDTSSGYITASTLSYATLTNSDFTVVAEFTPEVVGTDFRIINRASTDGVYVEFQPSGIQWALGATSSVYSNSINVSHFSAGKRYVAVASFDRDGNLTIWINSKKVADIDISAATGAISGDIRVGGVSTADKIVYHSTRLLNRKVTDAEAVLLSRGQRLGFADRGATGSASYTSDFSAGVDGWTVVGGTSTGNIDAIGGEDDTLRFTSDTSTGQHYQAKSTMVLAGKRYRITGKVYVPSTNTNIDGFSVAVGGSPTYVTSQPISNGVTDTWIDVEFEVIGGSTTGALFLYWADGGSNSFTGVGTDVAYSKDWVVTPIGEVLSLLPSGAAPTVWADQSGNGYNGSVTSATLINPMPLHADAFVSLTNLPTSSAGLATGRVWNDSGTLKVV